MRPKYRETVKQLTDYYMAERCNDYKLTLFVGDYLVYSGYLECYMGEVSGYEVEEFFCDRKKKKLTIYAENR